MNTSVPQETVPELFNRAFSLHQGKQRDVAKVLYEEVLTRDPRHAHATHSLGVIASEEGRRKDALELFQRAISINGKDVVFYHNLGRTLQAEGRSTEAVHAMRKAVEINPEFLGAWQALAEIHYSLNNTTEAARAIQKVADLKTKTAAAHNQKGLALVKEKRLKEAVEEFRSGMACNPRGAGLYFNAGNVLSALGQHADAISCLTQAASLEPKTPRVYVFLSNAHYRKGDLDGALRARAQAWRLDPTLPDEQFEVSASPIVAHPKRPVAMGGTPTRTTTLSLPQAIQQAVERHNAGDGASAEMLYRKVLEVDPVNADALHLLGVILHQRGNHRGALELIDRVVVRDNASANVHANRASVLISLGELDAAEASARRALEIDPSHQGAKNNIAVVERKRQGQASNVGPAVGQITEEAQKKSDKSEVTLHSIPVLPSLITLPQGGLEAQYRRALQFDEQEAQVKSHELCASLLQSDTYHADAPNAQMVPPTASTDHTKNLMHLLSGNYPIHPVLPLSLGAQHAARALQLSKWGDLTGAKAQTEASLAAGHESADLHNLRGILFSRAGLELDAVSAYERALTINPRMVIAHCNLAISLRNLGRLDAAIAYWNRAMDFDPAFTDPYILLALEKIELQEFAAAEELLRRALVFDSRCVPAFTNLGWVFHLRDQLDAAIRCYRDALTIDPSCVEAHVNVGSVFHRQRKVLLARASFEKALALEPNSIAAKHNLGQTLLLLGDFSRGWPCYEARFAWWQENGAVLPKFNRHRWAGQEIAGLTLLLVAEQGFGDTLQFVRYASILAAKGATVLVECQADLVELLRSLPGVPQIYARGDPLPDYDLFCPLMSLPMLLNTSLETIPGQAPYIRPNPLLVAEWKERIGQTKSMKVGFAWSGNPRSFDYQLSQVNRRRSVPLETCQSLLTTPGVEFFSVQKDYLSRNELTTLGSVSIREFPNALHDFSDTAALISNLDLVISVDTAVAHLAGAMGKPVWMMSRYDGCWRWLLDRTDSPWYPTMHIFRQPQPGDWGSVISEVKAALTQRVLSDAQQ